MLLVIHQRARDPSPLGDNSSGQIKLSPLQCTTVTLYSSFKFLVFEFPMNEFQEQQMSPRATLFCRESNLWLHPGNLTSIESVWAGFAVLYFLLFLMRFTFSLFISKLLNLLYFRQVKDFQKYPFIHNLSGASITIGT